MKQTAVEWLFEQLCSEKLSWNKDRMGKLFIDLRTSDIFQQAKAMESKEKLKHQLFIGKVTEIIGFDKTVELLKECNEEII
jgi:hypothetical protein